MSNPSLKEQLQALSIETPLEASPHQKKPNKLSRPEQTLAKQAKPAWLESAQYGVELLKAYFPQCFKEVKEIQPLKIGIKQDLVKYLSTRDEIVVADKACMVQSLSYYVNSASYHKMMVAGASRIDLEGHPAGTVTAEEATYSVECRKAKTQKKPQAIKQ